MFALQERYRDVFFQKYHNAPQEKGDVMRA
jgi:hypothetical protein